MTDQPAIVRVSGADELLSTIPLTLGFHPVDSLVLVCLQIGDNRIGPICRVDLAGYRPDPAGMADYLAPIAKRHADRCLVVFYGADADPGEFTELLIDRGLPVLDTLFVDNATEIGLHPQMQAEYVVRGHAVADSREQLRAQVEFQRILGAGPDPDLVYTMGDSWTRDQWVAGRIKEGFAEAAQLVLSTCRRVPDPDPSESTTVVANLCSVAAMLSYRAGNGALAQICLDRAMRVDPYHSLTQLILELMSVGIAPEELDTVTQDLIQ